MNGIVMREGRSLVPNAVSDIGWSVRAVNDINGDKKPDIIWEHTDGRIAAWIMNGLTMASGVLFTPDRVLDPNWRIVGPHKYANHVCHRSPPEHPDEPVKNLKPPS
jgi:hypothetical protein